MPKSKQKLPVALLLGQRLRWLREFKELTLKEFAARLGCDPGYLSKLENGKAENPSDRFLNIVRGAFLVQPEWLWLGKGDPFVSGSSDERTKKALPDWSEKRLSRVFAILDELPEALAVDVVLGAICESDSLEDFQSRWHAVMDKTYSSLPATARLFWNDVYTRVQLVKFGRNPDLTDAETSARSVSAKAQLPELLERLKKATAEPGKKTALAAFLKVPLASISRWLSGEREPGGEVTLQLLRWVELQERQAK